MARTAYYMQAANPYLGISAGSGTGASSSDPAAFSRSTLNTQLNNGNDVYLNRGGLTTPTDGQAGAWATQPTFTAAPSNLGRVFLFDGYGYSGGSAMDPFCFDANVYDAPNAGGWTSIGNNLWTKNFNSDSGYQIIAIYAQAVKGRGMSTTRLELRQRANSQANCTALGDWFQSGTTTLVITINSGSNSQDPSQVFGGLALHGKSSRFVETIRFTTAKRLEFVDPILLLGSMRLRPATTSDAITDLYFNELQVRYNPNSCFETALASGGASLPGGGVYRIRLVNPTLKADTRAEAALADPGGTYSYTYTGIQHSLQIWGQTSDVSVVNPTLQGGRHALIEIQTDTAASSTASSNWPRNIEIYGTTQGGGSLTCAPGTTSYTRAFAIATYGGVRLENLTITNQTVQSQLSGRVRMSKCYMKDFQLCQAISIANNNYGTGPALSISDNGTSTRFVLPADVRIESNIIENPSGYPIRISFDYANIMASGAVKIYDNTIIDQTYRANRLRCNQAYGGTVIDAVGSIDITNNSGVPTPTDGRWTSPQYINNNLFICDDANILVSHLNTGTSGVGTQIASSLNGTFLYDSVDLEYAYNASGNLQYVSLGDAGLSSSYVPSASSGVVGANNNLTARLDFDSMVRLIPTSVGAKETA